ncbi:MAG TPA: SUMF1/EgtB/PvdO family nonheme iron enzyme [Terriglobales bacterium]|nr:SUMF1/EgtB/PvdO family nonheme iron enzyme [Terriglobales bacterium]
MNSAAPRGLTPRRLAAIVAGDIAGYSRLMELEEEGTHARVKRIQRDLIEPSIAEHHGRLVKTTGDGFIAIFDSPLEAVRCAIGIQQNMSGRNTSLPRDHQIKYRIGINLGDVIVEEDDIYGDGVNVASRLESIADPGEVFISGGIYEQIKRKLVCGYESLGDRKVKNITDPVRVYRVLPDPTAFSKARTRRRRENALIFLLSSILLGLAGGALWYTLQQQYGRARLSGGNQLSQSPRPSPSAAPVAPGTASPAQPAASAVREPEMNMIRDGTFMMGSNDDATEKPIHQVTFKPFAISRYPISVREWNECAAAKACGFVANGKDDAPVTNVSWSDAKQFVTWLSGATHKPYRLPSEAEWEYAARGGTQTKYWWGDEFQPGMANCKNCTDVAAAEQPVKVGSFKPNPFGLFDMGGGVDQWVEDCWHRDYHGASSDGSPWIEGDCLSHVIRSGSWKNDSRYVRPANRDSYDTNVRYPTHGFRVALSP